jgi:hypothetical protein
VEQANIFNALGKLGDIAEIAAVTSTDPYFTYRDFLRRHAVDP